MKMQSNLLRSKDNKNILSNSEKIEGNLAYNLKVSHLVFPETNRTNTQSENEEYDFEISQTTESNINLQNSGQLSYKQTLNNNIIKKDDLSNIEECDHITSNSMENDIIKGEDIKLTESENQQTIDLTKTTAKIKNKISYELFNNTHKNNNKIINLISKKNDNINEGEQKFILNNNGKINILNNLQKRERESLLTVINKLNEEKNQLEINLQQEILNKKQQNNYIQLLKQTIENKLLNNAVDVGNSAKSLEKNPIDFVIEFTELQKKNEKLQKDLVLQQVISTNLQNEVILLKKDNEELLKNNKKQEDNIEKLKEINNNLMQTHLNLNENNEKMSRNFTTLMSETNKMKEQLNIYQEKCKEYEAQFKVKEKLEKEVEILKEDLGKEKNNYNKLFKDLNILKENHSSFIKQNNDLTQEKDQLMKMLLDIKKNRNQSVSTNSTSNLNNINNNTDEENNLRRESKAELTLKDRSFNDSFKEMNTLKAQNPIRPPNDDIISKINDNIYSIKLRLSKNPSAYGGSVFNLNNGPRSRNLVNTVRYGMPKILKNMNNNNRTRDSPKNSYLANEIFKNSFLKADNRLTTNNMNFIGNIEGQSCKKKKTYIIIPKEIDNNNLKTICSYKYSDKKDASRHSRGYSFNRNNSCVY